MFLFFILQLFFLIWRMCFFCNHYVFCFFSIYFFFSFLCRWVSHHIPKRERKKNEKSGIQNPDQKASKRVCPTRVCPTSVSARSSAQQLPIHFDVLFAQFFSCHQSCGALHGILVHDWSPPRIKTSFCFCKFTSTVSKMSSWKSPEKCAKFGS